MKNKTKFLFNIRQTYFFNQIRRVKLFYENSRPYFFPLCLIPFYENNQKRQRDFTNRKEKKYIEFKQKFSDAVHILKRKNNTLIDKNSEFFEKMKFSCYALGFTPMEYVSYEFEKVPLSQQLKYISNKESINIGILNNDLRFLDCFSNKMKTYQLFKDLYKRDIFEVTKDTSLEGFKAFVNKHPCFIKKDAKECCGRGIEFFDLSSASGEEIKKILETLKIQKNIILEELIEQSDDLKKIYDKSVNTTRIITVSHKDKIYTPFAFFKCGQGGSKIDNGGAGGILVGIDISTGKLFEYGYDEANVRYSEHPDTKISFSNFQLPNWKSAIELCILASKRTPKVKIIGWDVVYTPKGWIIVEGNFLTEFIGPQCTRKDGCKNELISILKGKSI